MAGLTLFVALYFVLSGWFAWTAYRLLAGLGSGNFSLWGVIAGVCAAFLAIFMLKALFFVKHSYDIEDIEITRAQQPRLFEFIDRIADEAQAPHAHKVYLSPRVNAAVFYDLSLLNLFFPSKKNLEIGLGLVNVVTLGELKAILAHEFGHFAQRSMAVGRWVYIAQQIAGHIVAKRDMLDTFLQKLSRLDIRVAWIGWVLSVIVWSIRSLMDILFRGVVIAQRALSRQMEFQADLVAVSLTGSDALINALHGLGAADEAWDRAVNFAGAEAHNKRRVQDVFSVQSRIIERMREILNQPNYGAAPPVPAEKPAEHRVFKTQLAQPPRMWSTHPANEDREQNAKQRYVSAPIDARSAWDVFDQPASVREQMSVHLFRNTESSPVPMEQSLQALDKQYARAFLNRAYRGAYLGRSIVRNAKTVAELYAPPIATGDIDQELAALYPDSLATKVETLSELREQKAALAALRDNFATAPGGVIRHRDRELQRKDLPAAVAEIDKEIAQVTANIEAHDRRCRRAHLSIAEGFGNGWAEYLRGLVNVLHYADHTEADLADAQGLFFNVYRIVTADGRVSAKERKRLVDAADQMYGVLARVHENAAEITLDRTLTRRLEVENWQAVLGKFDLPPPNEAQLGDWLGVIDSWVGAALGSLAALRTETLEQLLVTEEQVAKFHRGGMRPPAAAPASIAPAQYSILLPGNERPLQTRLDWWDKFHTADGPVATGAKLLVAAGVIGGVMAVGGNVGQSTITIYNGLQRNLSVEIGGKKLSVGALASRNIEVSEEEKVRLIARTDDDQIIDTLDVQLHGAFVNYVYNVAGATPLYQWTAVYGGSAAPPSTMLGAERWSTTAADHIFEEPPQQVKSKGETRRVVLASGADLPIGEQLDMLADAAARERLSLTHARWDVTSSPQTLAWLWSASNSAKFPELLATRLNESPRDELLLRVEQDTAGDRYPAVCAKHKAAATAAPDDAGLQYAGIRCMADGDTQDETFLAAHQRWPNNGWLTMASGYVQLTRKQYAEAEQLLNKSRSLAPALSPMVADEVIRLRRLTRNDTKAGTDASTTELLKFAPELRVYFDIESSDVAPNTPLADYSLLARGGVAEAGANAAKRGTDGQTLLLLAAGSDGLAPACAQRPPPFPPMNNCRCQDCLLATRWRCRAVKT